MRIKDLEPAHDEDEETDDIEPMAQTHRQRVPIDAFGCRNRCGGQCRSRGLFRGHSRVISRRLRRLEVFSQWCHGGLLSLHGFCREVVEIGLFLQMAESLVWLEEFLPCLSECWPPWRVNARCRLIE